MTFWKKKSVPPGGLQARIRVLDRVFSEYVRLRLADRNGFVKCMSCGRLLHWQACDAGHYVSRRFMGTRWDLRNVWPQCQRCNRFAEGEKGLFARAIDRHLEPGTAELLDHIARARPMTKYSRADVDYMIAEFRALLSAERKIRGNV